MWGGKQEGQGGTVGMASGCRRFRWAAGGGPLLSGREPCPSNPHARTRCCSWAPFPACQPYLMGK